MPANLTPQYKAAELRYQKAATRAEKEEALREMIALLPKHKGTEKLQADLRRRLSKLEAEAAHVPRSGHRAEVGHVTREGAGQWVLLGPPNGGKSSLLQALTHARPQVADYPFTTRDAQPGMMSFEDVQVQLVDTPALASGHTEPWLANLARGADGLLLVVDLAALDQRPGARALAEFLERAHLVPSGRPAPSPASPLILVRPALLVANKCDLDLDGTLLALARDAFGQDLPCLAVSALRGDGLDLLRPRLYHELHRIRVHTKEPGHPPDPTRPFVLREGATVEELAQHVHADLALRLRFARLWGSHARFDGQLVDRHHVLADGDVVELHG